MEVASWRKPLMRIGATAPKENGPARRGKTMGRQWDVPRWRTATISIKSQYKGSCPSGGFIDGEATD